MVTAMNGQFWKLWSASAVFDLGEGIARSALPLLAASLTRDPQLVAGLMFALTLPWLLLSLPAGALADKLDRKLVMISAALMRVCLTLLLGAAIFLGRVDLGLLYAIALLLGATDVFYDTTSQTV